MPQTTHQDQYFLLGKTSRVCRSEHSNRLWLRQNVSCRASRRFENLKDEVQYRKRMYGEVTDDQKPANGIFHPHNKVGQQTQDTNRRTSRIHRPSLITPLSRILPDRLLKDDSDEQKQPKHLTTATSLKTAFGEFYLMLILLQKYQLLNYTGFRKILKKHDKLFQTTRGIEWR